MLIQMDTNYFQPKNLMNHRIYKNTDENYFHLLINSMLQLR